MQHLAGVRWRECRRAARTSAAAERSCTASPALTAALRQNFCSSASFLQKWPQQCLMQLQSVSTKYLTQVVRQVATPPGSDASAVFQATAKIARTQTVRLVDGLHLASWLFPPWIEIRTPFTSRRDTNRKNRAHTLFLSRTFCDYVRKRAL